ncbi:MAG: TatD family hydrolase [Chloroflexota bacterium]|nr:MAG: TatD family hydrolase [Chloroflexota bacterium]
MAVAQLIDTHCHLDFQAYSKDLAEILSRARAADVGRVIVPAIDLDGCHTVVKLAEKHSIVLAAVGVHPNSSAGWRNDWVDRLRHMAGHETVVAIGEIGLDYFREHSPRRVQQEAFEAQLALAHELDLPVIIHNRLADDDILRFLRSTGRATNTENGVLHSFSSPLSTAETAMGLGYYLGFTGPITFKKADELRSVAAQLPLYRLLVETDGPFLTPHPYRGKRNEPAYVRYIAERLAEVKQITQTEFARQTTANAARLFGPKVAVFG